MSLDLFTLPLVDVTHTGYRMVSFSPSATGITPISFLVAGMGDYVDLECSYLEVELRLHITASNGIVADANSASDGTNTKFLYVTNNLGHTNFKQINLYLNGIVMSTQTNTYAYEAFF